MKRLDLTGQRLVALFVVGWLLLDYPLLSLFAAPVTIGGVPLLYAWVFAAWLGLIVLMALVVERPRR